MKIGLTITFKRDDLSPQQHMYATQPDDKLLIFSLDNEYLADSLETAAILRDLPVENHFYLTNMEFLSQVYFAIRYERNKNKSQEQILAAAARNLEWVMFFMEKRIALSQLIQKLNEDCFIESERGAWLDMCNAWGNKASEFEVIFWRVD